MNRQTKLESREILQYIILLVLTLIMGFDGIMKVMGNEMHLEQFHTFGYATWFMILTGVLEILTAVFIWFAFSRFQSSFLILLIMVFAAMSNVRVEAYYELFLNAGIGLFAFYTAYSSRTGCVLLNSGAK